MFGEVLEQLSYMLRTPRCHPLPKPLLKLDYVVILISVDESTSIPILVGEIMLNSPVSGAKLAISSHL